MTKVSPEILKKIRDSINVVELVGESVTLRKSGHTHKGLCPFHSERTPSFYVNETKQFYHCFGCQKHGDVFQFVMELDGVSFPEAVEILSERARVALPKDWRDISTSGLAPELAARRAAEQEKLTLAFRLNRFVSAYYHRQLKGNPDILKYFTDRGVNDEAQRGFYAGLAPSGWDSLARELADKKAPLELAQELGLIRPSQKGLGPMDLFRGRAMFPILDMRGRVAGFGGRILPQESTSTDAPKYLNSPESVLFKKSKLAFGLYQAQKEIRELDQVILVEGYFDVVAMHVAGFKNVVSPCGTTLGPDLLAMLRRLAQKIIILFDGDSAGITATDRAMEMGLENGLVFYGVTLPQGMDPDQVLIDSKTGQLKPEGVAQMKAWIDGAQPILDSRIQVEAELAKGSPEAKAQALKKIAGWLTKYSDPVGRSLRAESLAKTLSVSQSLVQQALGGGIPKPVGMGAGAVSAGPPKLAKMNPNLAPSQVKVTPSERLLLLGILSSEDLAEELRKKQLALPRGKSLTDLWSWTAARDWVEQVFLSPETWQIWLDRKGETLSQVADAELKAVLSQGLMLEMSENQKSEWNQAVQWRVARIWARFSQEIKQELRDAESKNDSNLQEKLLQEYLDVQRKIEELKDFYDEADR